jgi:hypothetical protein
MVIPPLVGGIRGSVLLKQLRSKLDPEVYDRHDLNRLMDLRSDPFAETGFFAPHWKSDDQELIRSYRQKLRVIIFLIILTWATVFAISSSSMC